jgi:hypothetical protein
VHESRFKKQDSPSPKYSKQPLCSSALLTETANVQVQAYCYQMKSCSGRFDRLKALKHP